MHYYIKRGKLRATELAPRHLTPGVQKILKMDLISYKDAVKQFGRKAVQSVMVEKLNDKKSLSNALEKAFENYDPNNLEDDENGLPRLQSTD